MQKPRANDSVEHAGERRAGTARPAHGPGASSKRHPPPALSHRVAAASAQAQIPRLAAEMLARGAGLAGMGRKSGELVVGLSAVRRTRELAVVLMEEGLSVNTRRELARLRERGVQVCRVADLRPLTMAFGRSDVHVIAIKRGALARGMMRKLGLAAEGAAGLAPRRGT